jgi:hypothetical protein
VSLAGSAHYANIREKTRVLHPKSGDEDREAFEGGLFRPVRPTRAKTENCTGTFLAGLRGQA